VRRRFVWVPHGSGYPLYARLGKGFAYFLLDIGFRMNLMAAVFGVLGVLAVYSLIGSG